MQNTGVATDLLLNLFTPVELLNVMGRYPDLERLRDYLPIHEAPLQFFTELANAIERHGLWDLVFKVLVEQRPLRASEIGAVAAEMGHPIAVRELQVELAERERRALQQLEQKSADFVADSKRALAEREVRFRRAAYLAYVCGMLLLIGAATFASWRSLALSSDLRGYSTSIGWAEGMEFVVLSVTALTLMIAGARYSFILGKDFMTESVRNADRGHAISFGEFYLRAYGKNARWEEIKDAFQHWNIGDRSTFTQQDPGGFDPKVSDSLLRLAEILTSSKSAPK